MIIDRYKCIYTNIPKTGSRSIKKYLDIEETHFPLYKDKNKDGNKFENYYKFSFVRNPWDRLVSTFSYLSKGGINDNDKKAKDKYIAPFDYNFKNFVLALDQDNIWQQVHLKPQYYWVCKEGTTFLLTDFIGYFENFETDWKHIKNKLNIDRRTEPYFNLLKNELKKSFIYKYLYNIEIARKIVHKANMSKSINKIGKKTDTLPHVNKSVHNKYADYYDMETQKHVELLYKEDIELFNYKFQK